MKKLPIFLLILISFPTSCFAWAAKGHALVAQVAFSYIDADTRKHVLDYLGGMTFEEASNWMDVIKSDRANDYMKPYHYVDIDKGSMNVPSGDNIITTLNRTLSELDHKETLSRQEIKRDILFLMHLVGDLHQPLHVGYPGDKGGNDVKLTYLGRSSNLHAVWDSEIIDTKNLTLYDIMKANADKPKFDPSQKVDVIKWASESRSHLSEVYHIPAGKIDDAYVDTNAKVIQSQIYDAGVRLAVILEKYFKTAS